MKAIFVAALLVAPALTQELRREDGRCGPDHPLADGSPELLEAQYQSVRVFYEGGTSGETFLSATCADVMKVWFDGALQRKTAAMSDWKQTSILTIPELTRVVAIECRNKGGVMGLIASTSTGLKTDTSWQCSGVPVTNWTLPGFVSPPNTFANALNGGKNGVAPWRRRPQISKDAEWIWPAGQSTNEAYCRGRLGDYEDVVHISPSFEANLFVASKSHLPDEEDDDDLPGDSSHVTLCTAEGSSELVVPIANITSSDIFTSRCVFILTESDSNVTCPELHETCVGLTPEGTGEEEFVALSAVACWRLQWCPGRVTNVAQLCNFPQCCFHPSVRPADMGVWSCLVKYTDTACTASAPNPLYSTLGAEADKP